MRKGDNFILTSSILNELRPKHLKAVINVTADT